MDPTNELNQLSEVIKDVQHKINACDNGTFTFPPLVITLDDKKFFYQKLLEEKKALIEEKKALIDQKNKLLDFELARQNNQDRKRCHSEKEDEYVTKDMLEQFKREIYTTKRIKLDILSPSITLIEHGEPNYDKYYDYLNEQGLVSEEKLLTTDKTLVMELDEENKAEINLAVELDEWEKLLDLKPRPNKFENTKQHPHFIKIMEKIGLTQDTFEMRHEQTLESDRRPDFIFTKKTGPHKINLLYCPFMVELQVQAFDKKHKGKLILYNQEVLRYNPSREFIISVLTNLNDIILLKSEMCPEDDKTECIIKHRFSENINFWSEGYKYIKQLHNSPKTAGYDEDYNFSIEICRDEHDKPVRYQLHKIIGRGATSSVFSLCTCEEMKECSDLVAKIFLRKKSYFDHEQKIMDKIAMRQNENGKVEQLRTLNDGTIIYKIDQSSKFIQRLAANRDKYTIIYTPRGHRVQYPITQKTFTKMFDCVRELIKKGIIHRDLSPHHFICTKTSSDEIEKVFLIDFGSAAFVQSGNFNDSTLEPSDSTDEHRHYRGAVRFAAKDVLDYLSEKFYNPEKVYTPHRRQDLESFVKFLCFMYVKSDEVVKEEYDEKTRVQYSRKFWIYVENNVNDFWKTALKITRRRNIGDDLINSLYEHFVNNFPCFKLEKRKLEEEQEEMDYA